jgi:ABC-type uncharacterized transport system substrate-binding protein
VIGFLSSASPVPWRPFVAAFRQGLNEAGYVEGKNVAIEFRWAEDHYGCLPALAAELLSRQVAVLVATGGPASAIAAKAALRRFQSSLRLARTLVVGSEPIYAGLRAQIVALVTRHAIPAVFALSEFVAAGGLITYGASLVEAYRQAGIYTGKILNGAKPADMPV